MIRASLVTVGLALAVVPAAQAAAAAPAAAPAAPAATEADLAVEIEPTSSSVVLGEHLDLTVTVANGSDRPTADLVVHLDITDPTRSSSVDPEDWTSTLSQPLGVLPPGGSDTVDWSIQPIAPGSFSVYAVAISPDTSDVVASGVLTVDVADQRSLDPGGILPVALGMPALVGGLLLARTLAARRATRPAAT